jgi:hypothetical protein
VDSALILFPPGKLKLSHLRRLGVRGVVNASHLPPPDLDDGQVMHYLQLQIPKGTEIESSPQSFSLESVFDACLDFQAFVNRFGPVALYTNNH